ncbi:MAG: hypothetical protein AKCLJLPJ_00291 [Fimbriimonadales bacterium]|nr:MAG: MCE family protein [Armatimonadota bacterium]MBV6502247.1 hypothetical protein [Fimbriimonadales bacterium]MCE7899084.1 MCE family protein [Armatimonadetes bacterium ATM1]MDL1927539.1 MCE family protein [Fimbriimonadia bacterium ATM]MBC6969816.1 MCE family protein [Armatimonadota bacterium]
MESAWKVGLLVVAFGALLVAAFALVGNRLFEEKSDVYYASLPDASNVQPGAVVTMAGVRVGRVSNVKLVSPTVAEMTLSLSAGTFVPADAKLIVPTSLLSLGEQRVELVSKEGADAGRLAPGSRIEGGRGSFLADYLPEGEATLVELNKTLAATREFLSEGGLKEKLEAILDSTKVTIEEVGKVMKSARGLIAANEGTLKAALVGAKGAIEDLRQGIRSVNALVGDPNLKPQVTAMLESLNATAQRAEELVANLNSMVSDPNLRTSIENTLYHAETIARTGTEIAANTRDITADGKVVSAKAIELADRANEIADEAKKLLEKLNEFADRLPSEIKLPKPSFSLETGWNVHEDRFQSDLSVTYPVKENAFLMGGLYDATETDRLILQYGETYGPTSLRYGIYASKPGVGVDWQPLPGVTLSGDLFNPNDLQFNVRARLRLNNQWYGWLGVQDLFKRNDALLGIGIRR